MMRTMKLLYHYRVASNCFLLLLLLGCAGQPSWPAPAVDRNTTCVAAAAEQLDGRYVILQRQRRYNLAFVDLTKCHLVPGAEPTVDILNADAWMATMDRLAWKLSLALTQHAWAPLVKGCDRECLANNLSLSKGDQTTAAAVLPRCRR